MFGSNYAYYVNYWCRDWRESRPLLPDQAQALEQALKNLGAETRIVPVGANVPPGTMFPDPATISEVDRVRYRLPTLKSLGFADMASAEAWQIQIQGLGLDVQVTEGAQLPGIPQLPHSDSPEILGTSWWSGNIFQLDQTMPAQLVFHRKGPTVEGELSFTWGGRFYRAKVRGELEPGQLNFHSYEAVEGNLRPTEYEGRLTSAGRLFGQWTYAPDGAGRFEFVLTRTE